MSGLLCRSGDVAAYADTVVSLVFFLFQAAWVGAAVYFVVAAMLDWLRPPFSRRTTKKDVLRAIKEVSAETISMRRAIDVVARAAVDWNGSDGGVLFMKAVKALCYPLAVEMNRRGVNPSALRGPDGSCVLVMYLRSIYTKSLRSRHKYTMAERLLRGGCSPNVRNLEGQCALHWAARHADYEMCNLLLKYGANPGLLNHHGHSVFDYARFSGDEVFISRLKRRLSFDLTNTSFVASEGGK